MKDVLFGRDKVCFNHVGNARFRLVISNHAEEYEHAPCRRDKSCIVYNVFNIVKAYEGRFLKRDGGGWKEVSDTEATQKVGHALSEFVVCKSFCHKGLQDCLRYLSTGIRL